VVEHAADHDGRGVADGPAEPVGFVEDDGGVELEQVGGDRGVGDAVVVGEAVDQPLVGPPGSSSASSR
jgi:hypothetical protein